MDVKKALEKKGWSVARAGKRATSIGGGMVLAGNDILGTDLVGVYGDYSPVAFQVTYDPSLGKKLRQMQDAGWRPHHMAFLVRFIWKKIIPQKELNKRPRIKLFPHTWYIYRVDGTQVAGPVNKHELGDVLHRLSLDQEAFATRLLTVTKLKNGENHD